ncbi:MAG: alpha/beta fold hydrolase, partial [Clostridia bacterium]|nr:alpha/beta fold hydrolase [Clostridia bacterium]
RKMIAMLLALTLLATGFAFAESDLKAQAEADCDALLAGDFAAIAERFDENMAAVLDADGLAQSWSAVAPLLGDYLDRGEAELNEQDGYTVAVLEARFANSNLKVQIAFDGEGRIAGMQMQPVAPETAVEEETGAWTEVELTVEADPAYPLGATLCLPEGGDAALPPVVVLVQGSGSSDRNEAVLQNAPFRDIAHGLAELGVATLRYDKRTFIYPECAGDTGLDIDIRGEMLDDVNAAIALMRTDGRVDGSRIFVLGHSLGGMMVPAIAAENPDLAGAISMAGSLRRLWEIVYDQNQEAIAAYDAVELPEAQRATLDAQVAQIEADMATFRGGIDGLSDDALLLGVPARYWKSLEEYAGERFIDELELPLLILQGDADFQVYADVDYPLWQQTLEGRENVTFCLYEGLNHLMMPTQGLRDTTEYVTPSHVREDVIADIAAFVNGIA